MLQMAQLVKIIVKPRDKSVAYLTFHGFDLTFCNIPYLFVSKLKGC